jgi:hypothetical protein
MPLPMSKWSVKCCHVANLKQFKITQEKRDPAMRKECVSLYGGMWEEGAGDLHCTRGIRGMSDPAAEAGEKWGSREKVNRLLSRRRSFSLRI